MFKLRSIAVIAATTAFAASAAFAQFAERNIKITNGVNEDHPAGAGVSSIAKGLRSN